MSSQAFQRRRGTTANHASFTGLAGEVTVDTTKNTTVVHNGVKAGGFPLALESHASWGGTAGGTANALTVTTGHALTALITGTVVSFKTGASANTGAATIVVDSVAAKTIQKNGSALVAGDLPASTTLSAVYDGTYWQLVGGSGGSVSTAALHAAISAFM